MGMESIYRLSLLVNLVDRFSGPSAAVQRAVSNTTQEMTSYSQKAAATAKDSASLAAAGVGLATAAMAPAKATFATQNALAELASLGIQDLGRLESAAEQFSSTWAGTTKPAFLTAAYDIKSGIASLSDDGVAGMTRIAGVTAKATKATITEMTALFATGYSIYKDYYGRLSDLEFGEMFSSGIAKSVQKFKTTGSGMAQAISALGKSATNAGAPLEEQLAILGMLQATMGGSQAGTQYAAFLQTAAKAGKDLGLSFTYANGQLKSMPEVLMAIKGKFGETMTAADKLELQKAFGTIEAVKLIDLLYSKTNDLQDNILTLYDTMGQGMSVTKEMANKINAPPGQGWILLKQQWQAIVELAGGSMLPTLSLIQQQFMPMLSTVADFVRTNPALVSGILYTVAAIGGLVTALGLLKGAMALVNVAVGAGHSIVTGLSKGWKLLADGWDYAQIGAMLLGDKLTLLKINCGIMLSQAKTLTLGMIAWVKQGIMAALTALPGLIASVWGFTAALLANPITWVVVGVMALIAALVLLWQNWDTVTQFFVNGFNTIKGWFSSMPGWIQAVIAFFMPLIGIPMLIVNHWEQIKAFFTGMVEWFRNIGSAIWNGFTNGIMSVINAPFDAVKGALDKVRQLLPFSDAKTGPLSDLTLSGSRVFTTFNDGMATTASLPSQTAESAFSNVAMPTASAASATGSTVGATGEKVVQIDKVILYIKPEDIADLQKLKKLLAELDDGSYSNAVPNPA